VLHTSESWLFRQLQLYIEVGTYRNDAHRPDWYPDPLIPFQHQLPGKKLEAARFNAVPFDLPANETHGIWVDLYVPAETPPGEYQGIYRVTSDGGKSFDVPVMLTVWNFTLPRIPTLVTAFGSPAQRMRNYYRQRAKEGKEPEPSDWQAVEEQCAQLLSEHRLNATPPAGMLRPQVQPDGSYRIPVEQVQALREFVDRYNVNALDIPHPSGVIKDPEAQRDKLRAWLAAFDRAAKDLDRPQVVFYVYLKDEPNTREEYQYVQRWGRAIRDAKSVVQVMVVEQTWTEPGNGGADSAWGDLYGAVDIWCPLFSLHRQDSAAKRQALGETIWTYTALCQGKPTPWWHVDYPLLNYRVPAWMAWRDRMKGLLYWGGMSYWQETDDPWLHVPVYTGRGALQQGDKGIRFNGEGSLVYPARATGYDGIVPTVRLKALRDAIEDYEYLAILDRLGKAPEAERIVRQLTGSWFQWDKDPAAYEKARAELAAMTVAAAGRAEVRALAPQRDPSRSGHIDLGSWEFDDGRARDDPLYTTYGTFAELMAWKNARYPKLVRVSEPGTSESPNYTGFFFYQCQQFDPTDRYILGMRVHCQNRDVRPIDRAEIGFIDLQDGCKWTQIGETTAWNWQQGARLQWRPGSDEILWNDRSDDGTRYVCRVYNFKNGARRTLPRPIYTPSPDGTSALTHDFERMKHGGTPYVGIEDKYAGQLAPKETGIWKMDLNTGDAVLIMSLEKMARIAYPQGPPSSGCLYVFREGWNPAGSRFIAFVKDPDDKFDKAFSLNPDGSDVRYLYNAPSHHEWRDDRCILDGRGYYLYEDDGTGKAKDRLFESSHNGHVSYIPGPGGDWILSDTYAINGYQYLFIYHIPTKRFVPLAKLKSTAPTNVYRVDLHPRLSRDRKIVSIDATHEGLGRQMYMIDIAPILDNPPSSIGAEMEVR